MSVVDVLKKSLYFGVGAAAFSAEKLKQFADEMVARGEMSSDEAKKFVDDMSSKAEEEKKTAQDWISERVSNLLHQAGAAESARVDALERRVADLEKRIAEMGGDTGTQAVEPSEPAVTAD